VLLKALLIIDLIIWSTVYVSSNNLNKSLMQTRHHFSTKNKQFIQKQGITIKSKTIKWHPSEFSFSRRRHPVQSPPVLMPHRRLPWIRHPVAFFLCSSYRRLYKLPIIAAIFLWPSTDQVLSTLLFHHYLLSSLLRLHDGSWPQHLRLFVYSCLMLLLVLSSVCVFIYLYSLIWFL